MLIAGLLQAASMQELYDKRLNSGIYSSVLYNSAARYFFVNGNVKKAEKILKKNLKKSPNDPDSLFLMAAIFAGKKNYTKSKDMIHLLLKKNPRSINYLNLMVFVLDKLKKKKLADAYREVLGKIDGAKVAKSRTSLKSIMKIASATSMLNRIQTQKIDKLKNEKKNLYFYKSKLSKEKQNKLALKNIKMIESLADVKGFNIRNHKMIFEQMKEILEKAPDSNYSRAVHWKSHYYYLGLLKDGEKDWTMVQVALESYITKYPNDRVRLNEAYDKLAIASSKINDWSTMLYYTELYLNNKPNAFPMLLNQARALSNLGEIEKCIEVYKRIMGESPNSVQFHLAKSDLKALGYDD